MKEHDVIITVMSNMGLEKYLKEKLKLNIKRTDVGDINVINQMKRSKSSIGGEQSGHIIISNYSNTEYELDSNSFKYSSPTKTLLSGGEGLVDSGSTDSFSSTTTATFSAEAILGGVSSDVAVSEAVSFDYQYQIGLTTYQAQTMHHDYSLKMNVSLSQ